MAGLFGLSINPETYEGDFKEDLFWGTSYLTHLSEEKSGLAAFKKNWITHDSKPGLFAPNFKNRMADFDGTEAIGYCGQAEEPFLGDSELGPLCACFIGNIINSENLLSKIKKSGGLVERGDEVEVILNLIAQGAINGKGIVKGIKSMTRKIKGAYSLLMLTRDGIYAVCCPNYRWPLVIGQKKGAVVVGAESGGFDNLDFKLVRDIEPGEILLIKNGSFKQVGVIPAPNPKICTFRWVYTDFVNSIIKGIPTSLVRKRLGVALARRDIKKGFIPHIVIPVPDSGRLHAIGYYQEFVRQMMLGRIKKIPFYDEYLHKYGFSRSFLRPTHEERQKTAHYKIVISGETINHFLKMLEEAGLDEILEDIKVTGRIIIVICDDSVVRGIQIESNLAPKVTKVFEVKTEGGTLIKVEIHVRSSNPELLSHCPWGKTTKKGETLAQQCPKIEDRIKRMGIDGLGYSTINDLVWAIGLPKEKLCVDCSLPPK